jgi:2',3'-cyclic-nucleotide 2'-phosphodiesterase (5'-nucleotidase family)
MRALRFFAVISLLAVGGSGDQIMAAPQNITILFTGDRHGHIAPWLGWEKPLLGKTVGGMDRLASVVREIRREVGAERVLLLDSGDAIGDTFIAAQTKGRAVVDLMNLVGYDAMTIGNHEPDFTPEELRLRMREAKFPFLAANVFNEDGSPFAQPYMVRNLAGVKVGILGLGYAKTPLTTAEKNVRGMKFGDPLEAARKALPQLEQEGAEIIVALAHGGLGAELKWAEELPGIHVVVGGHSHNRVEQPLRTGNAIVVQAGAHGADVGRLDLEIEGKRIVAHRLTLVLLDNEKIPSAREVAERMQSLAAPYRHAAEEIVGTAVEPIIRAQTMAGGLPRKRNHESPADSLFADILRQMTGADVALLPGVGYGVAIPKGPITVEMLRNLIPHDSKVVTCFLTGHQVRQVLEQSLTNTFTDDPQQKVGGMIQVSGLEFIYDRDAAPDRSLLQVRVGGDVLEDSRKYRVATNTLLASGGHNYSSFREAIDRREHGEHFEMVRSWIKEQGQIRPPAPGRIRDSSGP